MRAKTFHGIHSMENDAASAAQQFHQPKPSSNASRTNNYRRSLTAGRSVCRSIATGRVHLENERTNIIDEDPCSWILRTIAILQANAVPLLLGVVCALVFANVDIGTYEYYFGNGRPAPRPAAGQAPPGKGGGGGQSPDVFVLINGQILGHLPTIRYMVNDCFMALFFGIATKEITEACLPGGSLNPPAKAANPLLATVGGVGGPVAVFFLLMSAFESLGLFPEGKVDISLLTNGWGIVTATDIALAWAVARKVFGDGHPAINYLLLLAIADDGVGLVIVAVFYGDPKYPARPAWLLLCLLAACMAAALRQWHFRKPQKTHQSWAPYVFICGPVSWLGLVNAALHPALALVFVVPFMPGPHRQALEAMDHPGRVASVVANFSAMMSYRYRSQASEGSMRGGLGATMVGSPLGLSTGGGGAGGGADRFNASGPSIASPGGSGTASRSTTSVSGSAVFALSTGPARGWVAAAEAAGGEGGAALGGGSQPATPLPAGFGFSAPSEHARTLEQLQQAQQQCEDLQQSTRSNGNTATAVSAGAGGAVGVPPGAGEVPVASLGSVPVNARARVPGVSLQAGRFSGLVGHHVVTALQEHARNTTTETEHAHTSTLDSFEHDVTVWVDFGMFVFALCNAGVKVEKLSALAGAVYLALLLGKVAGITGMALLADHVGFPLPDGMRVKEVLFVSLIASVGLTVALFVADAAYDNEVVKSEAKMGALLSGLNGIVALLLSRVVDLSSNLTAPRGGSPALGAALL
jgi:Na+/H+ antiporter NhaA